jgi:uncharacterized membrane protein
MTNNLTPDKRFFLRMHAGYRLLIAFCASISVYISSRDHFSDPAVILFSWIGFALMIIILNWIVILSSHPQEVRKIAKLQDSSQTFIFLFVITASVVSMTAIIFLLKSVKGHSRVSVNEHILLAIVAVCVSWWLVHTIFTLRYAHLYYDTDTDKGEPKIPGGLIFPREKEPDYLDFVYFSFIVGMTFQVSDVEVSSREIRRLVWLHGLLSFVFNTTIVALSINVISGLVAQ